MIHEGKVSIIIRWIVKLEIILRRNVHFISTNRRRKDGTAKQPRALYNESVGAIKLQGLQKLSQENYTNEFQASRSVYKEVVGATKELSYKN